MARDTKQAIDEILATLYYNDARGYGGVDAKLLSDEAKKRIQRTLATLDLKSRKSLEDEANYRLSRFTEFSHLPESARVAVLKEARSHDLGIEQAYDKLPLAPAERARPAPTVTVSAKPTKKTAGKKRKK
jgi:hypothetical protein